MNLYESIKNSLIEANEVEVDDKQLITSAKEFSKMLGDIANKYITKDVIHAISEENDYNPELPILKPFEADLDGLPKEPLQEFKLSNGEILYLYGPVAISKDDVEPMTLVTIGEKAQKIAGPTYSGIYFSPVDGALSLDYVFDNIQDEYKKEYERSLVSMLEDKQTILQAYETACKEIANEFMSNN